MMFGRNEREPGRLGLCEIFGIDDLAIAAVIAAGTAAYASSQGVSKTNAANAANVAATNAANEAMFERGLEFNNAAAIRQEAWNRENTAAARDWSAAMSNSAYQRTMWDMEQAGLNPILAYQKGGASTPVVNAPAAPGASAPGAPKLEAARVENTLGAAVSSAVQAAHLVGNLQQASANIDQTKTQTNLTRAEEARSRSQTTLNEADTLRSHAATALALEQAGVARSQVTLNQANEALQRSMRETEQQRPGQVLAQTGETHQRTATESERTTREREEARLAELRRQQFERYGPPGQVPNLAGSAEAVGRRVGVQNLNPLAGIGLSQQHWEAIQNGLRR